MVSRFIPWLLNHRKSSNMLKTKMVTAMFNQFVSCISSEYDAFFLVSLYQCFTDSLLVIGGHFNLSQEYCYGIINTTKHQLQVLADKQKRWSIQPARAGEIDGLDMEDVDLYEKLEEFILQEKKRLLSKFWMGMRNKYWGLQFQVLGIWGQMIGMIMILMFDDWFMILHRLGCPCFLLSQIEIWNTFVVLA